ncbi:MAG TPA: hypothetical protein VME66_03465 [Candidatus Acidoferrales bacterium]|nr:hypothetical protein [Candidatus Acidoferrales bacterium]
MLLALLISAALSVSPAPASSPSPERLLALIRAKFRSHRPPPPYVTYTLVRSQLTDQGYPDYVNSYTYHIWCRTLDRAALGRKVFRADARGPLEFQRPAFNEPRDPGPPTADVFEPAPLHPHPIEFVPTPEPVATALPLIGSVTTLGEFDYEVESVDVEGDEIHLRIEPIRDPERNRLREIWADKTTYELRKIAATDKLFVDRGPTYSVAFTVTFAMLDGTPVITAIHGDVGDGYFGDGQKVDYVFSDITFPASLPAWYFDPHTYAAHQDDAPL